MVNNKIQKRTRRANHEGSIFQRKDGLWVGSVSLNHDENGKPQRKVVYGKTKMDVINKVNTLTNRISNNNYDLLNNNTLSSLMKEWLLVFKKAQVTARTFDNIFRQYRLHIDPKIGGMKIDEITTITLQKLINEMLEEGFSLDYVKKIKFILRQFFEYAVDNKLLQINPVNKIKIRSKDRKVYNEKNQYKAIPREVREKFIKCLNNHDFLKPLCLTMMCAGLRSGEALALQWHDIDFENKTISIERALTVEPKFDSNGKIIKRITLISDTKTACSKRVVPMPELLIEALNEYKLRQQFITRDTGIELLGKNCLVFGNNDGSVRTYAGTRKTFNRFLEKYDLQKYNIHFHGLRHTYSNMLFEAEQNPKLIQQLLGHKDVKTTLSTYNSIDQSYFDKAANILNKQFRQYDNKKIVENINEEDIDDLIKMLEDKKLQNGYSHDRTRNKPQEDFDM